MIDRHGRDASPVVDAGVDQPGVVRVGKVRRSLDVPARTEHDSSGGHRGQELLLGRFGMGLHGRPGLRPEVLDDDLLEMPVLAMEVAEREERLGSLPGVLPDPHEDAGGERDRESSGLFDRPQAHPRYLVGRAEVRTALHRQPVGRGLEHDPH